MSWPFAWGFLFGIGLVLEAIALIRRKRGDTLSEQIWLLRTVRLGRSILAPAWAWLTVHIWLPEQQIGIELAAALLALIAAQFMNYRKAVHDRGDA